MASTPPMVSKTATVLVYFGVLASADCGGEMYEVDASAAPPPLLDMPVAAKVLLRGRCWCGAAEGMLMGGKHEGVDAGCGASGEKVGELADVAADCDVPVPPVAVVAWLESVKAEERLLLLSWEAGMRACR